MYTQTALLLMVLMTSCHTNVDAAAQDVQIGTTLAQWMPLYIPIYFPRIGWSSLKFDRPLATISCTEEGFYSDPLDCTKFYRCIKRFGNDVYTPISFTCAPGTVFSHELESCVLGTCSSQRVSSLEEAGGGLMEHDMI